MATKIELRPGREYLVTTHEPRDVRELGAIAENRRGVIEDLLDELQDERAAKDAARKELKAVVAVNNDTADENAALRKWRSDVTSAALAPDTGGLAYADVPERVRIMRAAYPGDPAQVQEDIAFLRRDRGRHSDARIQAERQVQDLTTARDGLIRRVADLAYERDFLKRDRDRANTRADRWAGKAHTETARADAAEGLLKQALEKVQEFVDTAKAYFDATQPILRLLGIIR
jgi:hypothetical protein